MANPGIELRQIFGRRTHGEGNDLARKLNLLLGIVLAGCAPSAKVEEHALIDPLARRYAELFIASESYDDWDGMNFVGPADWRKAVERRKMTQPSVRSGMIALISELKSLDKRIKGAEPKRRVAHMMGNLDASVLLLDIQAGAKPTIETETRRLYGMAPQPIDPGLIPSLKARLDAALPGPGTLKQRYAAHLARVTIPKAKFQQAFQAAMTACRQATLRHLPLPKDKGVRIVLDRESPSVGSMYYEGNFSGKIVLRPEAQSAMETLVLACHEAYPGHFVHLYLRERHANETRWPELYVLPIRSALLWEGLADFGFEAAMTTEQQRQTLTEVIMPVAGIDPALAALEQRVWPIANQLRYFAAAEAARLLRSGTLNREQTGQWFQENALATEKSADSFLRFIDASGAYIALYAPGLALVRQEIEKAGGTIDRPDKRWSAYQAIVEDVLR